MFEKYKKEIIILSIVIIIPLVLISLYYIFRSPVESEKTQNGNMPYINIKGRQVEAINNYISDIYKFYSNDKKTKINYKTFSYKDIVSVLVEINEFNTDYNEYIKKFVSFNVKKDGTFVDKEELATMFGYDLVDVVNKVEDRLKSYYAAEINEGYVEKEECNFECYLSYARGISNILDDITLVIENNRLVVYINLSKDDVNGDNVFFKKLNNPYRLILE